MALELIFLLLESELMSTEFLVPVGSNNCNILFRHSIGNTWSVGYR